MRRKIFPTVVRRCTTNDDKNIPKIPCSHMESEVSLADANRTIRCFFNEIVADFIKNSQSILHDILTNSIPGLWHALFQRSFKLRVYSALLQKFGRFAVIQVAERTTLRDIVILCFWNTSTREISLRCKSSTECRWYKISRNAHFESVRESPAISRRKHRMVLVCVTQGDPWFAMEQFSEFFVLQMTRKYRVSSRGTQVHTRCCILPESQHGKDAKKKGTRIGWSLCTRRVRVLVWTA